VSLARICLFAFAARYACAMALIWSLHCHFHRPNKDRSPDYQGLLRQVPLVSSVLNWFSPPPPKQVARAGRAFDLSSGELLRGFCLSTHPRPLLAHGVGKSVSARQQRCRHRGNQ
jgi:hypothetical protein